MSDARIVGAERFFGGERPPRVPGDASTPDFNALVARAAVLDPSRYPITALTAILARENHALGAAPPVLDMLTDPEKPPVFVVAGQQAGLFGGPLYTLYKAMHAIRLASRLAGAANRPVLPLFWIASDDHDMDEVSHLGLRSGDGSAARVSYAPSAYRPGMPVGDVMLDEGIEQAVERLAASLPPGDAAGRYLDLIRSSWQPGTGWTRAFAAGLMKLLGPYGLIVIDPRRDGLKRLMAPVMREELARPLASTALVNEAADRFDSARERKHALRRPADATNLFLEVDGLRQQLAFDGAVFHAGGLRLTATEAGGLLDTSPERFSPGAALRPVCQDALMPVTATISGPGERRYLGQLDAIYRQFGVSPSIPWPRASFTVIDRRTGRYITKEGVEMRQLFAGIDRIESVLARETLPAPVDEAIAGLEDALAGGFERLEAVVGDVDGSLIGAVRKDRGRIAHILAGIRERIVRAHKSTLDMSKRRLGTASHALMPGGGPQERWFGADSILPVLDEIGMEAFIAMMSPGEEQHRIVSFE